jgi:hypothetical protein
LHIAVVSWIPFSVGFDQLDIVDTSEPYYSFNALLHQPDGSERKYITCQWVSQLLADVPLNLASGALLRQPLGK